MLASVELPTFKTISALVWHSHEFVDRGVYLESAPNLHRIYELAEILLARKNKRAPLM